MLFPKIGAFPGRVKNAKVRHRVQSEFWSGTLWAYRGARGQNDDPCDRRMIRIHATSVYILEDSIVCNSNIWF